MTIEVSKAKIENLNEIARIYHQTSIIHHEKIDREFKSPKAEDAIDYLKSIVDKDDVILFKAEFEDKIVGYLVLYINNYPEQFFVDAKRGFIGSIGVDEDTRGKGIGKSLLSHAEKYLLEQGISIFETDVYTFNTGAENLYNKFGFEDIKRYKRKFIK